MGPVHAFTDALLGALPDLLEQGSSVDLRVRGQRDPASGEWVVHVEDAAAERATTDELLALAEQDPLTGLANRRAFDRALAAAVSRSRATHAPLSVAVLDIDHFKAINDRLGHPEGDRVLVQVAGCLRAASRTQDLVARIGGEEFAILLPGAHAEDAVLAGDRARRALAAIGLDGVPVTASAGVCELADADDSATMLRQADTALYWAKAHGRNLTLRWTPAGGTHLQARARTWAGLVQTAESVDRIMGEPHGLRVAELALALAVTLDWPADRQARLHQAALVHDIGKIAVSPELLSRPGPLTPAEHEQIRQHPIIGAAQVRRVLGAEPAIWVHQHHERWDGSGYPEGAAADSINPGAQLLAIADAFAAMTSDRPYAAARHEDSAQAEVDRCSGAAFRPDAGALLLAARGWLEGQDVRERRAPSSQSALTMLPAGAPKMVK